MASSWECSRAVLAKTLWLLLFWPLSPELPRLRTLAPEHVGATSEAQPTLYWDLAAASEVPVEITVVAEDGIEPLVEERLSPPVRAGQQVIPVA